MIYVTDTHSLVWFLANDSKLGKDALSAFRSADEGKSLIVIPAIVIAEVLYIAEKRGASAQLSALLKKLEESANYVVYNLNLSILIETQRLKKLKDMHDRIIVATANIVSAKLITRDSEIRTSGYVETVW